MEILSQGAHPFILEYQDNLLDELGMKHLAGERDMEAKLNNEISIQVHKQRRGKKVAMARFTSLLDSLASYRERWTLTLFRLLHLFMDGHRFRATGFRDAIKRAASTGENSAERASIKGDKLRLRDACANNIALSAALLADEVGRQRARVMECITRPIRQWHGNQAKKLRSLEANRKWFQTQLAGGPAIQN